MWLYIAHVLRQAKIALATAGYEVRAGPPGPMQSQPIIMLQTRLSDRIQAGQAKLKADAT